MGSKVTEGSSQDEAADSQPPESHLGSPRSSRWVRGVALLCLSAAALSRLAPGAATNFPLSANDGLAMFLQIFHGRPIITGYVSRPSEDQWDHVVSLEKLRATDPRAFVRKLRDLGVRTAILGPGTPPATARLLASHQFFIVDLRGGLPLSDARPRRHGASRPRS
jgi:hypothetical protein